MKPINVTSGLVALSAIVAIAGCATTSPSQPAASATTTVVTEAGGPSPSAAIPGTVRQHATGEVMYVNRQTGRVRLRTPDGQNMVVTVPPFALSSVREGDRVSLDVTFTPR